MDEQHKQFYTSPPKTSSVQNSFISSGTNSKWRTLLLVLIVLIAAMGIIGYVNIQRANELASTLVESNDRWRVTGLADIKNSVEFWRRDFGDYPETITSDVLVYSRSNKDPINDLNGIPLSEFHYFRCSDEEIHLGVSLYTDKRGDPNEIGLDDDLDSETSCPGDPINGLDDSKCVPGDEGNYCFDLNQDCFVRESGEYCP